MNPTQSDPVSQRVAEQVAALQRFFAQSHHNIPSTRKDSHHSSSTK